MITSTYNVREKNANVFAYIKIRKLKAVSGICFIFALILAHKEKKKNSFWKFLFVHGKFD